MTRVYPGASFQLDMLGTPHQEGAWERPYQIPAPPSGGFFRCSEASTLCRAPLGALHPTSKGESGHPAEYLIQKSYSFGHVPLVNMSEGTNTDKLVNQEPWLLAQLYYTNMQDKHPKHTRNTVCVSKMSPKAVLALIL